MKASEIEAHYGGHHHGPKKGGGRPPISDRLSSQYRWKLKRIAAGLCGQCGREILDPGHKSMGPSCIAKQQAAYKAKVRARRAEQGTLATLEHVQIGEAILFGRPLPANCKTGD